MYQLNNRYWLETDDFFKTIGKITDKNSKGILPTAFLYNNSPLATSTPTLPRLKISPQKHTFCKETSTNAYHSLS